ncbi:hypothetical protein ACFLTA_07715 [Bacteroidota bacterium]
MGYALRIILIIVIAWYVIRIIDRVIAPALFGTSRKEKTPPRGKSDKEFRKSTSQGDVTITDYRKRSKDMNNGEDDYVDFEEVE